MAECDFDLLYKYGGWGREEMRKDCYTVGENLAMAEMSGVMGLLNLTFL